MKDEKSYFFDNPKNLKRLFGTLYVACAVAFGAEFLIHRHVDHPWEGLFGFYAIYGFGACLVLVIVSKILRLLVMRREDYYDD